MSPQTSQANRERRQQPAVRIRRTNDQAEIDQLKAEVHCGTVLEQQAPPWQLDRRQSTRNALKYRRGAGEILIVNHGGRGWFAHQDQASKLTGIEMRGPRWRGFSADSDKSLFQLPGGDGAMPRLVVVEAPIDVLSLASLEGPRSDTLYLATAGGLGPTTIAALRALLAKRADLPAAQLVAATDADSAGEHYAAFLAGLAREAGVTCERLRPPRVLVDWNAILVRAGGLVAHATVHS